MKTMHDLGMSLRATFPARASEWALGIMLFNWSVILLINPTLFDDRAVYHVISQLMPQPGWALVCFIAGAGRLVVLSINGMWRRTPHLRAAAACVGALVWFEVTIGLLHSDVLTTGVGIYSVLFFLDSYNVVRAMGEAGRSDAIHSRMAKEDGSLG